MRRAQVLTADDAGVARAAEALRSGELVAFPTETVYGLGANALLEASVLRIFEVKGRPLSDPLIVHVANKEDAAALADLEGEALQVFEVLTDAFWPGALTMVVPARAHVPEVLGAGTGTVGLRCPSHALARKLLACAGVPVAAPSANRFGHTSPTRASHVMDDLSEARIFVLDGDGSASGEEGGFPVCENGIESTVCQVDVEGKKLRVFRAGAVTPAQLSATLQSSDLHHYGIEIVRKHAKVDKESKDDGLVAPGQILTHYAPDVPTYLVVPPGHSDGGTDRTPENVQLSSAIVLDLGGRLEAFQDSVLYYRDLSAPLQGSSPAEGEAADEWTPCRRAASRLFEALRETETIEGGMCVLMPFLSPDPSLDGGGDEYRFGVADRMFRAASGKQIPYVAIEMQLRSAANEQTSRNRTTETESS